MASQDCMLPDRLPVVSPGKQQRAGKQTHFREASGDAKTTNRGMASYCLLKRRLVSDRRGEGFHHLHLRQGAQIGFHKEGDYIKKNHVSSV